VGLSLEVDSTLAPPVLVVSGEIDLSTAPAVGDELQRLVDDGNPTVIVDLDGVDFLDSTGLGALVKARSAATAAGGTLPLVCGHTRIRKLFEITGLEDLFQFHDSVEQARAAATGSATAG
jgi:anti-sigma B factor antagonist